MHEDDFQPSLSSHVHHQSHDGPHLGKTRARKRRTHCFATLVMLALCLAIFSVAGGPFSSAASAHYYAEDELTGSSFLGAYGDVEVNNIGINPGTDFLDNKVWVASDNGAYWVEAGIDKGFSGYGCANSTSPMFFWADNRPNGGSYHCHQSKNTAALNTYYPFDIAYAGGGDWLVSVQNLNGTSQASQTDSTLLEGGIEETSTSIFTCGHISDLGYYDADGNPVSGWRDASDGDGFFSNYSPPYASWTSTPSALKDWGNESCSSSDFSATANSVGSATSDSQSRGVAPTSLLSASTSELSTSTSELPSTASAILTIANAASAANGDSSPTAIDYATGSRQADNMVASGDVVPGNDESTLIVLRGAFIANDASVPEGQPQPEGSVMTLVVDDATGEVTDFGLSNTMPDLAELGSATTLESSGKIVDSAPASRSALRRARTQAEGSLGFRGIVTGSFVAVGGPQVHGHSACYGSRCALGGTIRVFERQRLVTREYVRAGAKFWIRVAPGSYQLRGENGCRAVTVKILSATVTSVLLRCDIK